MATPHAGRDPEYIKADLKRLYGTTTAFERARGLPHKSVTDLLRGKTSRATAQAIAAELGCSVHDLFLAAIRKNPQKRTVAEPKQFRIV